MTHSPDHAERADLISRAALKAKLDALIVAAAREWGTGSQEHNLIRDVSDAVNRAPAAALRGRDRVVEALEKIAAFKAKPIRGTVSEQSATLGWNRAGEWAARVAASGLADRAALHDAKEVTGG